MLTVKKATEQDLGTIWVLDCMVLGNSTRKDLFVNAVKKEQCFIAQIGDTIVGLGVLEQSFYGHGFISLLIVHPNYRRRGVTRELIRYLESSCPTEKLFTSTNQSNILAQQVFEALGFTRSGYIENLDNDPEIIYLKPIRRNKI